MKKLGVSVVIWLSIVSSTAASAPDIWDALKAAQPQKSGFQVDGIVLVRDAFTFRLKSGAFFPLAEVSGRVVGGVFKGKGDFELKPAAENERRMLALRARQKDLQVLADSFEKAVFLFADDTAKELLSSRPAVEGDADDLASIYHQIVKKVEKNIHADLRLRLLPDLVEGTPASWGLFLACFDGAKIPPAIAVLAPGGLDRAWVGDRNGPETTYFEVMDAERGGCWYSERPAAAQASPRARQADDLDALHYSIDTTIRKNTDIEGRSVLRFRSNRAGVRVVPLGLFAKLRVSEVLFKAGESPAAPVPFVQGDDKSADPVLVILPAPLGAGDIADITTAYKGDDVLEDAGEKNYYVGARQNWYPNLNGFGDWAVYDLAYRIPKTRQIVSVGSLVETATEGDLSLHRFTSGQPVRTAGFNYGAFRLLERTDKESGVKVRVYTNPGEPDFVRMVQMQVPMLHFNTAAMAEDALADSLNTARIGTAFYGPLPFKDVAVTQQTNWDFGQSWPTLIYIPYMAFLDWVTRAQLGLVAAASFVEQVTPHEFAHQWWGHRVGSATYRDYWLEEAMSEFTVSLVIEKAQGGGEFMKYWERSRQSLLERPRDSICANWEAGPISMGYRLLADDTPDAYGALVYRKGAFVIHMLRAMLRDPRSSDRDHVFIAMMKDFLRMWAGRNATTADFQAVVERYAPAPFTGNMGWFFRQWIDGTALPKIDSSFRIEDAGNGRYRIKGSIIQAGVPSDFRSLIPLYLEIEKGRLVRCATVTLVGNDTLAVENEVSLPKKPLRMLVDPYHEWLTVGP